MEYNGYTNWETWEAVNLLTSYEEIYNCAKHSSNSLYLARLLDDALAKSGLSYEDALKHLNYDAINFTEVVNTLKDC